MLNPTAYKHRQGRKTSNKEGANPYYWHTNTVVRMLERREIEVQEHQAEDLEPVFITGECRMDEDFSRQTRSFPLPY